MKTKLWSTALGNFFEHYDTALYGFLSPFLAPLFFPSYDPLTAMIMAYALIPFGMIARPFGSLVFGWIGDRYGRERALFISLSGMSILSLLIAACPTFEEVGFWAPIILGLSRLIQNFLSAGESMGGAIYIMENSSAKKHDLLSSLFNASTIGGILTASAGVALVSNWRLLYVLGAITGVFGLVLRRRETFTGAPRIAKWSLWEQRKGLILIMITAGFAYSCYSIALVLLNGFIPQITTFSKGDMMNLNTLLLIFDFATLPLFGWVASKISREKLMLSSALLVLALGVPLFMLLDGASWGTLVAVRLIMVMLGVSFFAPYHAWAKELIPAPHRYMVISFGYALGSQLLGGPTASISLWLYQQTGVAAAASLYWVLLALAAGMTLIFANKRAPAYDRG